MVSIQHTHDRDRPRSGMVLIYIQIGYVMEEVRQENTNVKVDRQSKLMKRWGVVV
jgi:hypothetical protein